MVSIAALLRYFHRKLAMQILYENEGLMCGAGDGTRTRDVKLGKLAFYH